MHYYQFNIGDYVSHTRHLSPIEDIAYRRLLDAYYLSERPLNSGVTSVARQIGLREYEQEVGMVLQEFFVLGEHGWTSNRADKEIAHYRSKVDQASRAGKASAERRSNARSTDVPTDVQPTNNHEPVTNNHKPIDTYICPPDGEPVDKLPACQHQAVIDLYHQQLPTLRRVEVWNAVRQGYLRQRWREVAAELGKEKPISGDAVLDWFNDFFGHIQKSRFLVGKINGKDGRAFAADLEWIIKPSNFAKIVEGKYHGTN
jgi:uncharacterized protein YdaU (DUF1376 family)